MVGEYFPHEGRGAEFEDKPGEECGVFGIYAPGEDVAALTYDALFALQHRGQDAAGVAVSYNGGSIMGVADLGKIEEALHFGADLAGLPASGLAIGHVRYSTNETKSKRQAAQPMMGGDRNTKFALGHNGHLVNYDNLKRADPNQEDYPTDSRLITDMISRELERGAGLYDALVSSTRQLNGAYSLVVMGENKLFGIRDPKGFRPLMVGKLPNNGWALASEVSALNIIGAEFEREVEPGEFVEIDTEGLKSHKPFDPSEVETKLCAFEFVYFSRPDNVLEGELVASTRRRAGIELAKLFPVEADLVADAPDSGTPAAKGYAYQTGLPLLEALVKNRYVGRSFIAAGQANRENMIDSKFSAVREIVEGQRLVLVDDSIIRGSTTKKLVNMLFKAGAKEVHLRIASAPYAWPCFMGMDTGDRQKLMAKDMSVEEIRAAIGADSLAYLPAESLERTFGRAAGKVCMACMTGEYPIPIPEELLQT